MRRGVGPIELRTKKLSWMNRLVWRDATRSLVIPSFVAFPVLLGFSRFVHAQEVEPQAFLSDGRSLARAATLRSDVGEGPSGLLEDDSSSDDYELQARLRTNVRGFQRALLPGPGGAILETNTLAFVHQAASVAAYGVDTPLGEDGLDLQVAAYGKLWAGSPRDAQDATWDVATALVTQRLGSLSVTLGRQTVFGGAARYRRMDGALLRGKTDFGLEAVFYGGLSVLPRWDRWYGYHHLGDAYEQWAQGGARVVNPSRTDNWMAGFRLGWSDSRYGALGVSFHHQNERQTLQGRSLGVDFAVTRWERVGLSGDMIYSLEQGRWSDARLSADWQVADAKDSEAALALRGELLHTVPGTLLSQASVLSVFSYGEVNEAGGGLDAHLPWRMKLNLAGYAQIYREGAPGARLRLGYEVISDEQRTLLLRFVLGRVQLEQTGYVQMRIAASYRLTEKITLASDLYHYLYDEPVEARNSSSFGAAHFAFQPTEPLGIRLGGSLAQSPYAAVDAQVLGRISYEWERGAYGRAN